LLKYNQQANNATFNPTAKNAVFLIFDVTTAIIENAAPVIYTIGENSSVSNIRFSAEITALALVLINDNNTKETIIPTQTIGNITQTTVNFRRRKLFSLLFPSILLPT
jgi:hypothetical protein